MIIASLSLGLSIVQLIMASHCYSFLLADSSIVTHGSFIANFMQETYKCFSNHGFTLKVCKYQWQYSVFIIFYE